MHYIRFLKTPVYASSTNSRGTIKALITIVTDLGDELLDSDLRLKAFLTTVDATPSQFCQHVLQWVSGTRQQWIQFEIAKPQAAQSWRMVVTSDIGSDTWRADTFSSRKNEIVFTVVSDVFDTNERPKAGPSVQRRLLLEEDNVLVIGEDTGNSIARHIW